MVTIPEEPSMPLWAAGLLLLGVTFLFDRLLARAYGSGVRIRAVNYFQKERKWSIIALFFYAFVLLACDVKYYLSFLAFDDQFPTLLNVAGLTLFFGYLGLVWRRAKYSYQLIFDRRLSTAEFVITNIKTNLPIVLPWIILSLGYDLLRTVPLDWLEQGLDSQWGDLVFYLLFLVIVLIFFPPLVRRLWGCTPFPEGELRQSLLDFFKTQDFSARLYNWPLFEGKVLTAGVMGIFPGLRYVMITPALAESMTLSELEAVMAHEIGHVKRYHMLLYLLIIAGFSLIIVFAAEPYTYFLLSRDFTYRLADTFSLSIDSLFTAFAAIPVLVIMLLYFRYLFGYFIRNFERQADLHVFPALGSSAAIISAFEKIAILSGNTRDQPSWHHFGIGERVDYLEKCDEDPRWISSHHRKVRYSLIGFGAALALLLVLLQAIPVERLEEQYELKYTEAVLMNKARLEPENPLWLRLAGDLLQHGRMEARALKIYDQALEIDSANPELMNNVAWLLLTAEGKSLRDPVRALGLARDAAAMRPHGFILDTLATAYWANGLVEEAVEVEKQAIFVEPEQKGYYQQQIHRFRSMSYEQSLATEIKKEKRN
ncbi:MAG: M48 family metalloprotease [Thermodesulfobacteriota bacterium]